MITHPATTEEKMKNFLEKFIIVIKWVLVVMAAILAGGHHFSHATYLMTIAIFLTMDN